MREIKFRAWDRVEQKMLSHNEIVNRVVIYDFLDEHIPAYEELVGLYKTSRVYLQYTGLKDMNGKEIYEGYIVEIQDKSETSTSYTSPVYFINGGFYVDPHPAHKHIGLDNKRLLSEYIDTGIGYQFHLLCKVVGNIYENKELLKEGK